MHPHKLTIYNTLSDRQEPFIAYDNKISLYVCGITPYDYAHLGHGRCYVTFDTLYALFFLLRVQCDVLQKFYRC